MSKKRTIAHFACIGTAMSITNGNKRNAARILNVQQNKFYSMVGDKEKKITRAKLYYPVKFIPREIDFKEECVFAHIYNRIIQDTIGPCPNNFLRYAD